VKRRAWMVVSVAALAAYAYTATRSRVPAGPAAGDGAAPPPDPVPPRDASPDGAATVVAAPASERPAEEAPADDHEAAPTDAGTILVRHMEAPPIAVVESSPAPDTSAVETATASTATTSAGERIVVPRTHRVSGATLMVVAVAVSIGAIALGVWAVVSSLVSDEASGGATPAASADMEQIVFMLAKPSTQRIPVGGSVGRIVLAVDPNGHGMLVVDGLGPAATGRSYQAWLIGPGGATPRSAAVFQGTETSVPLTANVPRGATVAITLEQRGGAAQPSRAPKLVAVRSA
jgi:Anti-sigma-K factor rskA, C-terminal